MRSVAGHMTTSVAGSPTAQPLDPVLKHYRSPPTEKVTSLLRGSNFSEEVQSAYSTVPATLTKTCKFPKSLMILGCMSFKKPE